MAAKGLGLVSLELIRIPSRLWTGEFDLRVVREVFNSGKKKLRVQKYAHTFTSPKQTTTTVPVVVGALGVVSVNFKKYMKQIGVKVSLEVIKKTALLEAAKILREVPSV